MAKVLTVRNVPDDVYDALKNLADQHGRSLQQQLLVMLELSKIFDRSSPVSQARSLRAKLEGRALGDTIAELRSERDR